MTCTRSPPLYVNREMISVVNNAINVVNKIVSVPDVTTRFKKSILDIYLGVTTKVILGEGAYGLVYKAYSPHLGKNIAVKKFKPHLDPLDLEQEVTMLSEMQLYNIYGIIKDTKTGQLYMLMEFIEGVPLEKYIELNTPDPDVIRFVLSSILLQVSRAHTRGIAHLDIKTPNIIIQPDRVVLIDWGLACLTEDRINTKLGCNESGFSKTSLYFVFSPWLIMSFASPPNGDDIYLYERSDLWAVGLVGLALLKTIKFYPTEQDIKDFVTNKKRFQPCAMSPWSDINDIINYLTDPDLENITINDVFTEISRYPTFKDAIIKAKDSIKFGQVWPAEKQYWVQK